MAHGLRAYDPAEHQDKHDPGMLRHRHHERRKHEAERDTADGKERGDEKERVNFAYETQPVGEARLCRRALRKVSPTLSGRLPLTRLLLTLVLRLEWIHLKLSLLCFRRCGTRPHLSNNARASII